MVSLNFAFGMYSISQLKVLGRFKKVFHLQIYLCNTHKIPVARASLPKNDKVNVFLSSLVKSYSNSLSLLISLVAVNI